MSIQPPYYVIYDSSCTWISAKTSAATSYVPNRAAVVVGATVTVNGTGSCQDAVQAQKIEVVSAPTPTPRPSSTPTSHPTAPPTATPAPTSSAGSYPTSISQRHVLTDDYLGGSLGTNAFPWPQVAPYVSWALARGSTAESDQMRAAGIMTYYYTDPTDQSSSGPMYTSDESTFAHDCSGNRITRLYSDGLTYYLMNPSSSHLVTLWRNAVSAPHYNAVQEDNFNTLWGYTLTPCNYTPQAWLQASINEAAAFGYPLIYNGATLGNMSMNQVPNVIGGMSEKCYTNSGVNHVLNYRTYGSVWQDIENVELQMAQQNKLFFCIDTSYTVASNTDLRLYDVASFLLTYDLKTSVLLEFYSTPSRLHVEPESELVPLYPVLPTPGNISSLQVGTNVYGREYRACYVWGTYVGRCAVVVNTDPANARVFPYTGYHHTMTLSGIDVLEGGTMSTLGPPPPPSLAPVSAVISFN